MAVETRSEHTCFGGRLGYYSHDSSATGTPMRFAVYLPPAAANGPVPALYYLAGLTCTEETFVTKGGAQRVAAELGLALVALDTSPRGVSLPGDSDHWSFGQGAGFYVDATVAPWSQHYRMATYVNHELPALIESNFAVCTQRRGIFGHSMGGHGALVTALRSPERWGSVSAFAPIANPCEVPWGHRAFGGYLGDDRSTWEAYDASLLMRQRAFPGEILVDQGDADAFLVDNLHPEALEAAAAASGQALTLRRHAGYDHSYWFVQTFMQDHLEHHARALGRRA